MIDEGREEILVVVKVWRKKEEMLIGEEERKRKGIEKWEVKKKKVEKEKRIKEEGKGIGRENGL